MHVKAFGKQLKLYNANSITNQLALKFLIIVSKNFQMQKNVPNFADYKHHAVLCISNVPETEERKSFFLPTLGSTT